MSTSKWDDLYDRFTSRALWLCLLTIGFAAANFYQGVLSAVEFQASIMGAVTVYTVAKSATSTAAAWRPKTGDVQAVTVEALPASVPRPSVAARPKRSHRAKPKPAGEGRG